MLNGIAGEELERLKGIAEENERSVKSYMQLAN